jgi:septation ring formation regulator EzrA
MAAMTETTEVRLTRLESDVAHIRSDVADLKMEMRAMRDEFRKEFGELHKEIASNGKATIRGDLMTRIWMLLMCAAMLGVVARGLHWL